MSELNLTDSEAIALAGTTPTGIPAAYPAATANNWLGSRNKLDAAMLAMAALANELRVYEVDGNADAVGVRPGRATIAGVRLNYAGADPAVDSLANNDTTYIWLYASSGAPTIGSAIDGTGWPAYPHLRLAEVTMASGAITGIVDRRGYALHTVEPAFVPVLETQGDTGSASRIEIQGPGTTCLVRVRVCDDGEYADASNATIAAAGSTTLAETITAGTDLVLQSDASGLIEIDLTDATAETVTIRVGPPPLGGHRGDYSASLDVTHAAA